MSDTESYLYRYSWDKEDLRTYPWQTRYLYQPEILKYLNHIVDRYGLRKLFQLNTLMETATWIEKDKRWRVECGSGGVFNARYLVDALGILSEPNIPNIPGIESFNGDLIHTAAWPDIDLRNKRVGVIGNGSTGIQVMTALAPKVKRLISFQRSPSTQFRAAKDLFPKSTETGSIRITTASTTMSGSLNMAMGYLRSPGLPCLYPRTRDILGSKIV